MRFSFIVIGISATFIFSTNRNIAPTGEQHCAIVCRIITGVVIDYPPIQEEDQGMECSVPVEMVMGRIVRGIKGDAPEQEREHTGSRYP